MLAFEERVHALLGTGFLFIATGNTEGVVENMLVQCLLQPFRFHDVRVDARSMGNRADALSKTLLIDVYNQPQWLTKSVLSLVAEP